MKGTLRIRWFNLLAPGLALVTCIAAMAEMPSYHRGRTPSAEEIHAWDIAIGPAGKELPPGSATATEGAKIYTPQCAHCHGQIGAEGPSPADAGANLWPYSYAGRGRPAPPLLGSEGTLKSGQQVRTLGKFWPVATTIWDYINRAMPPKLEGSLSANQVYSLTAFLLFQNGIIEENDVMDAKSLPKVHMPNRDYDPK